MSTRKYNKILSPQLKSMTLELSSDAVDWLASTIVNNDGEVICNFTLLYDLLCRMRTKPGADESFRRPITLSSGKFQFSEEGLADDWKLGRKRVRRIIQEMSELRLISTSSSRTASSGSIDCVASWIGLNGRTNSNAPKTSGRG
jgi:hypothetical protein